MEVDTFGFLMSSILLLIYGTACIIAVIFTFHLDTYRKLEEKLGIDVFSYNVITALDIRMPNFNDWAFKNNKILGPLLVLLSIIDLKLGFKIINSL